MPLQEANFIYKIYWKPLLEKREPSSLANLLLPKEKWRGTATQISTIPIPIPPSKL
jgi:hypothetical protein